MQRLRSLRNLRIAASRVERRLACSFLLLSLVLVSTAYADIRDFIGRPLVDVRLELGGRQFFDNAVLALVETRVGETLSMDRVRQTIDHLIGLGRFEDVQVFAEPSTARRDGVVLRYVLTPVQRLARIEFGGTIGLSTADICETITERIGTTPSAARVPEIVDVVRAYFADHGYRSPAIEPRIGGDVANELATLILTIHAGARTIIGEVRVESADASVLAGVTRRLGIERGRPYDRPAIDAAIAESEDELRDAGHYQAAVTPSVTFSEDGTTADIRVAVVAGPRVRVVFAGDPLPENRRDELVPIRRERSVDLDLLEDASRNIEAYLRQIGYRAAQARYVREESGGQMVLTFTVARGPLHRLESTSVAGNNAVTLGELAGLLQLKPGEPFVDSRAAAVASAMTELYRVRGFARAAVKPELSILPEQSRDSVSFRPVDVRFLITEGERTSVGDIAVEGSKEIAEARVRAVLALTTGRPFYRPQLEADRTAVEQLYRNLGFQNVSVDAQSTLADDGRRIDIRWVIEEGPQAMVDHLLVTGNRRTAASLIRREVTLQPGTPLSEDAIVESQRRLAALGLFRRIRIVDIPHTGYPATIGAPSAGGETTRRDILIEVEESEPTSISVGGGVEAGQRLRRATDTGRTEDRVEIAPRGFFEISRRNLWGKNRTISLFTRVSFRPRDPASDSTDPTDEGGYGFNEYRVVGTFREPRPFNRPGDAQFTGFLEQAIRASYNFSRRGVRGEYARRVRPTITVSGRYTFDYTRLFDVQLLPDERPLVDRFFPQVRLSSFTGSVLRDSRNDVVDPQQGTVTGVDASVAARLAGSEVGFAKTFAQGFLYRPVPGAPGWVLAAGARLGLALGFARQVEIVGADGQPTFDIVKELPASERFFAGGDTTVRGFVLDRLGAADTLDAQGYPKGGNGLVVFNAELRAPYWKGLSAVSFLDVGNVFARASDVRLAELRPAAGVGVRYRSPVGPLRVDFGFNLDRQIRGDERERGMVFHISLGQAF